MTYISLQNAISSIRVPGHSKFRPRFQSSWSVKSYATNMSETTTPAPSGDLWLFGYGCVNAVVVFAFYVLCYIEYDFDCFHP